MAPRRRFGKKLFKSLLPILFVLAAALAIALASIVYGITRPPRRAYLVTPEAFSQISGPGLGVTDETWQNSDGTKARGWLLKGSEGAPAVVFLHRYGADRSWLFNLGVKLNEATNFTILWPDLRGHGLNPPTSTATFGTQEDSDVLSALDFLRTIKGETGNRLIGNYVGLYGVELGAYAALGAAPQDNQIRALVLDSLPRSADEMLRSAVKDDLRVNNEAVHYLVRAATRIYFLGHFEKASTCELAAKLKDQRVLLLSGDDAGQFRESTVSVRDCFKVSSLEAKTDLPLTGYNLPSATGEQGEGYDRRVIDFFDRQLR
ncbi:MAG TPA: hypothetical protein VJ124_10410 [Pyrinomonadaceae bacterium]|nr:hypothetical protein [Pyrinomonadaceae bacterium]